MSSIIFNSDLINRDCHITLIIPVDEFIGIESVCEDAPVLRWGSGDAEQVLAELRSHLESSGVDEDDAPVRKAYRYLRD